ncbi:MULTISPECIES: hypothetical protein [Pseudomonas]|uniref:hypothetical protein n=1 Tax=Pseudomonas TaxID=286 RepID=UPI0002F63A57|nr:MULTISPECIES: hypothetical protein [Pseudomonas]AIG00883.1 hypothetical protein HZ99_01280 [Pseudomonas fluorescens]MBT9303254.1 hypothetical protein [Pseudomonas sp. TAE6080]MRU52998.1 hypothetical protein [Pseudomonas gessardii]ONH38952.1 hypothetical protein BLL38_21600 [Pseudomonas gessardii]SDR40980.1 hypothetical protein SAMN04490207_6160 [Pseudomonas gessardii]
MSEVKRFYAELAEENDYGGFVLASDFDRVTAERDAALGREAKLIVNAERGKRKFQKQLQRLQVAVGQRNTYKGQVIDLQHRLTAADARVELLRKAHPFTNDVAHDVYVWLEIDAALKPAEGQLNQCDGCQAGIPVVNGAHRMGKPGGYPDLIGCTAKLYKPVEGGGDE